MSSLSSWGSDSMRIDVIATFKPLQHQLEASAQCAAVPSSFLIILKAHLPRSLVLSARASVCSWQCVCVPRQEKFAYEDGHRGQKWFLVDESGHEQLAVTAEERETRDGHYTYKAEGPLAQLRPLMASNMGMVQEWLEQVASLSHAAVTHTHTLITLDLYSLAHVHDILNACPSQSRLAFSIRLICMI